MKKIMKIAAMAAAMIALCVSCEKEGGDIFSGKQFTYNLDMGEYGPLPCCFDFGKTKSGKFIWAQNNYGDMTLDDWKRDWTYLLFTDDEGEIDESLIDEDLLNQMAQASYNIAYGKYAIYMEADYEVVPTDDASGVVKISMIDPYSNEAISEEIAYSGFDGEKCIFNCVSLGMDNVEAAVSTETIAITAEDPYSALMM